MYLCVHDCVPECVHCCACAFFSCMPTCLTVIFLTDWFLKRVYLENYWIRKLLEMPATTQQLRDLIIKKHKSGQSGRRISRELHMAKTTVRDIISRFQKTGLVTSGNVNNRSSRILSRQSERAIVRASLCAPAATASQLKSTVGGPVVKVSVDTVKRTLRRYDIVTQRPAKSPLLTKAKKLVRLEWARTYQGWTADDWKQVR